MRIFVVGATGVIGSHAARAMVAAGHEVVALARSDASAEQLRQWGIAPIRGDLDDQAAVAHGVSRSDATVFAPAIGVAETVAVQRILALMEGAEKGFVFCSGTGVLSRRTLGEWSSVTVADDEAFEPLPQLLARVELENEVKRSDVRGIRGIVVRPPAVWTHDQPHILVTRVVESVRLTGAACYIGSGLNGYTNVHAQDLGEVFRRAVEVGHPGATYHAAAGEVPNRWIAETVGRHFGVPTRSIDVDEAIAVWDKFYALIVAGVSSRSRSPRSEKDLGWAPRHTDMLASAEAWLRRQKGIFSAGPVAGST